MSLPTTSEVLYPGLQAGMENVVALRPGDEYFALPPDEAQRKALETLPPYEVHITRWSEHKKPETVDQGTFHQETVRFSDGAVRLMTRFVPSENWFGTSGISPYPISATDALGTGPNGFNRWLMEQLAEEGFPIIWLHHQGRHSVLPFTRARWQTMQRFLANKSVGRSAHHQLALLNHLDGKLPHQTRQVVKIGDSRSSMEGEAEEALAPGYGCEVLYADYNAECFSHRAGADELIRLGLDQLPRERQALIRNIAEIAKEDLPNRDFRRLLGFIGTMDMRPLNLLHEAAWMRPLFNGDSGMYSKAVPLDAVGHRTQLSGDDMSHQTEVEQIHSIRPDIHVDILSGPKGERLQHIDLLSSYVQNRRMGRMRRVTNFMYEHDMDLTGIKLSDVLEPEAVAA